MRISVVINTYNRAAGLERTLRALMQQTWHPFEVVVVNGPSTDQTQAVLERWSDAVRVTRCPIAHLGMSRNIGIEAAAGDVVAFIDDDSIPEPEWLADLAAGYDSERVGGVGGIVFDHTGMRLQYRYSVCDRVGDPRFDVVPPFHAYARPGADPFVYLQGTNASFRRRCLEEIGGFDEEIEFYLDETEVCLQLVDRGYELRPVPNAAVHHHYLPSHLRLKRTVWVDPYPAIKNRLYFALSHGLASRSQGDVLRVVFSWVDDVIGTARHLYESGDLTREQLAHFRRRAEQAMSDGFERGMERRRKSRSLAPADEGAFQPAPAVRPQGPRLRICFLSEDYPPGPVSGIGRFTVDLARGLATAGHEVHVITRSPDTNRVDFEDGVWVHRIAVQPRRIPSMSGSVLLGNLLQTTAFYHEVRRIHERLPVSLVSAPGWNALAFLCVLDRSYPTIVGLHTSLKTVARLLPSWAGNPDVDALLRLEEVTLRECRELHANSRATIAATREQFPGLGAREHLLPHGLADPVRTGVEPIDRTGRRRVLFVGRLERRKGADVLLSAAPELLRRHPDVEVVLVGRDTPHTELGQTYREWFQQQHAAEAALLDRVRFVGELDDEERDRWYASSDVFCAPSRYESFGLVLLEAMAYGLPVVSCDAGGIGEVVDGNGLLAAPGDVPSLLACLDQLLSDDDLRRDMGRRSRELFEKMWNLPQWVERVEAAYSAVAGEHQPSGDGIDPARLASLLAEVGAVRPAQATAAAADLLNAKAYPVDQPSRLVDLLLADDATFVRGCYDLLLGREPEETGLRGAVLHLRNGLCRLDYVEGMARSKEARFRGVQFEGFDDVLALWSGVLEDAVREILDQPDDEFCERLYRLVLLRAPDPDGRHATLDRLARGADRLEVIRSLAESQEAITRRLPTDWLQRLEPPPGAAGGGLQGYAKKVARRLSRAVGAETALRKVRGLVNEIHAVHTAVREMKLSLATTTDTAIRAQRDTADAVAELSERLSSSTNALASAQREEFASLRQWLDVLGRKQQAMALELRERLPPVAETAELPEPQVVNPERLDALLRSGEPVRVNLGCGEKPLPGHLNVDARPLPDVDIVADARRLPFEPGSVDEVVSHHLIEHFRSHHLRTVVLPYWRQILRPGGLVKITCPNGAAMVELSAQGEMAFSDLAQVTFGMQDYEGDDHFAMYSPETLTALLEETGFEDVQVVTADRRNGLSVEMELWARKPAGSAAPAGV